MPGLLAQQHLLNGSIFGGKAIEQKLESAIQSGKFIQTSEDATGLGRLVAKNSLQEFE